jgi:hypothetical protein
VLGSNGKLEHYYPNDDPEISVNTTVRWYVGLTNSMGSVQYVVIVFKLGNESIAPPNETSFTPSPAPVIMQYSRVLLDNETWEFPFQWSIIKVNRVQNAASLTLYVNGMVVDMPAVVNQGGRNFRIIIELWVYNSDVDAFEFGWSAGTERRASWLQVWFNATLPIC